MNQNQPKTIPFDESARMRLREERNHCAEESTKEIAGYLARFDIGNPDLCVDPIELLRGALCVFDLYDAEIEYLDTRIEQLSVEGPDEMMRLRNEVLRLRADLDRLLHLVGKIDRLPPNLRKLVNSIP